MKKSLAVFILAVAFLALAVGASAGSAAKLKANVPFAFYVGKELLPAGEYVFEIGALNAHAASSSGVVVRNQAGAVTTMIFTMPGVPSRTTEGQLRFNRYGSRNFLSSVECLDYRADLKMSKAEKEYRAQAVKKQETVIVAQN